MGAHQCQTSHSMGRWALGATCERAEGVGMLSPKEPPLGAQTSVTSGDLGVLKRSVARGQVRLQEWGYSASPDPLKVFCYNDT